MGNKEYNKEEILKQINSIENPQKLSDFTKELRLLVLSGKLPDDILVEIMEIIMPAISKRNQAIKVANKLNTLSDDIVKDIPIVHDEDSKDQTIYEESKLEDNDKEMPAATDEDVEKVTAATASVGLGNQKEEKKKDKTLTKMITAGLAGIVLSAVFHTPLKNLFAKGQIKGVTKTTETVEISDLEVKLTQEAKEAYKKALQIAYDACKNDLTAEEMYNFGVMFNADVYIDGKVDDTDVYMADAANWKRSVKLDQNYFKVMMNLYNVNFKNFKEGKNEYIKFETFGLDEDNKAYGAKMDSLIDSLFNALSNRTVENEEILKNNIHGALNEIQYIKENKKLTPEQKALGSYMVYMAIVDYKLETGKDLLPKEQFDASYGNYDEWCNSAFDGQIGSWMFERAETLTAILVERTGLESAALDQEETVEALEKETVKDPTCVAQFGLSKEEQDAIEKNKEMQLKGTFKDQKSLNAAIGATSGFSGGAINLPETTVTKKEEINRNNCVTTQTIVEKIDPNFKAEQNQSPVAPYEKGAKQEIGLDSSGNLTSSGANIISNEEAKQYEQAMKDSKATANENWNKETEADGGGWKIDNVVDETGKDITNSTLDESNKEKVNQTPAPTTPETGTVEITETSINYQAALDDPSNAEIVITTYTPKEVVQQQEELTNQGLTSEVIPVDNVQPAAEQAAPASVEAPVAPVQEAAPTVEQTEDVQELGAMDNGQLFFKL